MITYSVNLYNFFVNYISIKLGKINEKIFKILCTISSQS